MGKDTMKLKGIIFEDFINYKKISMTLEFPYCSFKCGKECQNYNLSNENNIEVPIKKVIDSYLNNPITESIVMQGLEPFDSFDDLYTFIDRFRHVSDDDIVIYTGYYKNEIQDQISMLQHYPNIIIKFGRYIPNQESHYDKILGVNLASNNQYAEKIS